MTGAAARPSTPWAWRRTPTRLVTGTVAGGVLSEAHWAVEVPGGLVGVTVGAGAVVTAGPFAVLEDVTVASGGTIVLLGYATVRHLTLETGATEVIGAHFIERRVVPGVDYHVEADGGLVAPAGVDLGRVTVHAGGTLTALCGADTAGVRLEPGATEIIDEGFVERRLQPAVDYLVRDGGGIDTAKIAAETSVRVEAGGWVREVTIEFGGCLRVLPGGLHADITVRPGGVFESSSEGSLSG